MDDLMILMETTNVHHVHVNFLFHLDQFIRGCGKNSH